jgi:uncharacterized membrane protein
MAWTDEQVDRSIGMLLRVGVITAAIVVLAAAIWYHASDGAVTDYRTFHGEPPQVCSATGVVQAALHGDAAAWIQLGLLILIATPVARVAFSVFAFTWQRDWPYVAITLVVLSVLLYGLW